MVAAVALGAAAVTAAAVVVETTKAALGVKDQTVRVVAVVEAETVARQISKRSFVAARTVSETCFRVA
jgi:hypothetical protein